MTTVREGGPRDWAPSRLDEVIAEGRGRFATAQEAVLDGLRRAILNGAIEPEAKLRQEDLAERFGTSRIPIREALRALEYEGLVESEPNRGFAVRRLSGDEIEEVYELRVVLESHAVRLAIPLMTELEVAEIDRRYEQMESCADPDEQLAKREELYLFLYSVTGRPRLVGLISRLRQEVARPLRWLPVTHSHEHHAAFFEAVKEGDADRAVAELTTHYRKISALVRRYLREADIASRAEGRGAGEPLLRLRTRA